MSKAVGVNMQIFCMSIKCLWKTAQDINIVCTYGKETRNLEARGGKGTFPFTFLHPFSFLSMNPLHVLPIQIIYTI